MVPDLTQDELINLRQVCSGYFDCTDKANPKLAFFRQLFEEGVGLSFPHAEDMLFPLQVKDLIRAGLLEEVDSTIHASLQIQYYRGLIFLTDFFHQEQQPDFVLPIGPSGRYLADLTIRQPVERALDLGCGCGIQCLLASRHSVKVTATDINPRALALTRINAELNGITNVEILEGSYFEPVAGHQYDLIVANLPYVMPPESRNIYCDVDQPGGGSIRKWLQEIPNFLAEDCYAQVLLQWPIYENQSWWQPVKDMLKDQPLDSWLIFNGSKIPTDYADAWIDMETKLDPDKFLKTRQEWVQWYQDQGIQQIGFGALTLRRRSAEKNWFRAIPVNKGLDSEVGDQFIRLFAGKDFLDNLGSLDELLNIVFHKVNLEIEPGNDSANWVYSSKEMRIQAVFSPESIPVLKYLDGQNSLMKAIQLAYPNKNDENQKTNEILTDIEKLIQLGMLVPAH
jgi:SAM-dependent methyltransferase